MSSKQISFFSTKGDLVSILSEVDSLVPFEISYLSKSDQISTFSINNAAKNLDAFTVSHNGQGQTYLLVENDVTLKTRSIQQKDGKLKVFYDQKSHQESVVLQPGGLLDSSKCMLAGHIGTISENEWSTKLFKAIYTLIRKRFTKIQSFHVGYEAELMFDNGFRLTTNQNAPSEYDLRR